MHRATNGRSVWLLDFLTGTTKRLLPAPRLWRAWDPVISDGQVAWTEWHNEQDTGKVLMGPTNLGPLDWKIWLYDTAAGTTRLVATGVQTTAVGVNGPSWPKLALDGDRIAYAIEDHSRAGDVWQVVVENIQGEAVRTVQTQRHVYDLGLSGDTIAYSEGTVNPNDGHMGDTQLVLANGTDAPRVLGTSVYAIALRDGRLAYGEDHQDVASGLAQGTQVWTAATPDWVPEAIGPFPYPGVEALQEWPASGNGFVSWGSVRNGDVRAEMGDQLCVWSPVARAAYQVEGEMGAVLSAIGGGWIAWTNRRDSSLDVRAMPVDQLPMPH